MRRLDINDHVERKKQIFIDKLINSENALMNKLDERKCAMLRIGEYSPNNSQLRVKVQPFLGIGEYEHQKKLANAKQKANLENNKKLQAFNCKNILPEKYYAKVTKAVQTDICNIRSKLVNS